MCVCVCVRVCVPACVCKKVKALQEELVIKEAEMWERERKASVALVAQSSAAETLRRELFDAKQQRAKEREKNEKERHFDLQRAQERERERERERKRGRGNREVPRGGVTVKICRFLELFAIVHSSTR